jgi:hypothetical protein
MKAAVDLHIHSVLSPCAHCDMTPNNIVNMALLKGLDVIAITDHNSCDNVEAAIKVAGDKILIMPGMEVQTREDVHLLCYFDSLDAIYGFDNEIRKHFIGVENVPEIFGYQLIMDEKDQIIGKRDELLLSSLDLSVEQVVQLTKIKGGAVVPAHVDRPSYSIISQLGFIPENLSFGVLEISHSNASIPLQAEGFHHIISSDAHELGNILEKETILDIYCLSTTALIQWFNCPCVV